MTGDKTRMDKQLQAQVAEVLAIEQEEARQAGKLGYMVKAMVQATMPHHKPEQPFFRRTNGTFSLTMTAHPELGLPYGTVPRLLMVWLSTEAVRTKQRELVLGPSLSGFMAKLGMMPTGGRWGTITRLRSQMERLFTCSVSYRDERATGVQYVGFNVAREYRLWWDPKQPDQAALWQSTVTLAQDFYEELVKNPVAVDLRALKVLRRSPLAIDLYCWLTYRMSYLEKRSDIPWAVLEAQFGADYARTRDFRKGLVRHLRKVQTVYPQLKVEFSELSLTLLPSKPHVPSLVDNPLER